MGDKWMQSAVRRPGALTRKAEGAGESISRFCGHRHDLQTTQQCNLARTFSKERPKGRAAHRAARKAARTRTRHESRR